MRIQLLKGLLVGSVNHAQGDLVEVDPIRGKSLVKSGVALEIKVTTTDRPTEVEAEPIVLRQAVANPPRRKGRKAD